VAPFLLLLLHASCLYIRAISHASHSQKHYPSHVKHSLQTSKAESDREKHGQRSHSPHLNDCCSANLCGHEYHFKARIRSWHEPSYPCCISTTLCNSVHCSICVLARMVILYMCTLNSLVLFYFMYTMHASKDFKY